MGTAFLLTPSTGGRTEGDFCGTCLWASRTDLLQLQRCPHCTTRPRTQPLPPAAPPACPCGQYRREGDPSDHAVYTAASALFLLSSKFTSSKTRREVVHGECREGGGTCWLPGLTPVSGLSSTQPAATLSAGPVSFPNVRGPDVRKSPRTAPRGHVPFRQRKTFQNLPGPTTQVSLFSVH